MKTTALSAPFRRRYDVTNSCDCGSIQGAAKLALAATLALVPVGHVRADRHCSPVLFRYYDARTALHETDSACPARLEKALDFMREAAAEAGACGCLDVEAEIDAFIGDLPAAGEDCSTAEQEILELDTQLESRVSGCN